MKHPKRLSRMRACTYSLLICSLILSASSQPTQKKTAKPDKAGIAGPANSADLGKGKVGKVKEKKGAGEGKEKVRKIFLPLLR